MITILVDDRSFVFSEVTLNKNPDFIVTRIINKTIDLTNQVEHVISDIVEIIDKHTFRIDMLPDDFVEVARYLRKNAYSNYAVAIESLLFQSQSQDQTPQNEITPSDAVVVSTPILEQTDQIKQ